VLQVQPLCLPEKVIHQAAEAVLKHIRLQQRIQQAVHLQQAVGVQVQVAHLLIHHLTQLRHQALRLAHQALRLAHQALVQAEAATDPAARVVEEEDNYSSFTIERLSLNHLQSN